MPFAAQPACVNPYACAAQVAAACCIAGVAVDAVDGDTCVQLTTFVVLYFVDTTLEGCVILAELTVISAVGTQLAPVVTGPHAAFRGFFITAQLTHTFHQVVAFDAPHAAHCHLGVAGNHGCFGRRVFFRQCYFRNINLIVYNIYGRRYLEAFQRAVQPAGLPGKIIQVLPIQVRYRHNSGAAIDGNDVLFA